MATRLWQFEDGCYSGRTVAEPVEAPKPVGMCAVRALMDEFARAVVVAHGDEWSGYPDDTVVAKVCGVESMDGYLSDCEWFSLWLCNVKGWSAVSCTRASMGDYSSSIYPEPEAPDA